MNNETFEGILQFRLEQIKKTLSQKGAEYSRGDRLSNFKGVAAARKITPEAALVGMWMKHIYSIWDMVDDIPAPAREGSYPVSRHQWSEKIGDAINYLILLEALVEERIDHIPDPNLNNMKPGGAITGSFDGSPKFSDIRAR